MDIDWRDDAGPRAGSTDITVLQPTVQGGYDFSLGGGRFVLETTLAAGFEFNVRTDGEDVGEGPILLLGLGIAHR